MMADWIFSKRDGGQDQGPHDAGVESFMGNLEWYLAREAIQNSLDARQNSKAPVCVEFELMEMERSKIPGIDTLYSTFTQCSDYWANNSDAQYLFKTALKLSRSKTITVLRIGDSNTTGVKGSDLDKNEGWYSLTRCVGASGKSPHAGGSFGLGKHAPFAASGLRTILYSTLTVEGKRNFIGVSKLVTHIRQGTRREHVGWFGGTKGESLTNKSQIPAAFRREVAGTDLYVLGYQPEEDWKSPFVKAVLTNFWPAIHRGDLSVNVDDEVISKKTLLSLLQRFSEADKDFDAHLYHRAYVDQSAVAVTKVLPITKESTVKLIVCDESSPQHVAMIRATGMVIYWRKCRCRISFAGVFECRNATGNQILRTMEPPQHDDWDKDRPAKGKNRRVLKEIDDFIIECIKKLTPVSADTTIAIPDLGQYLPDDGEATDEAFEGPTAEKPGINESLDTFPKTQTIPGRHMGRNLPTKPGGNAMGEGDGNYGEEDGGNEGGPENDSDGGNRGNRGTGDEAADKGGDAGRTPIDIKGRAFSMDPIGQHYSLIVHPNQPRPSGRVYLSVAAVGDDSLSSPLRITSACFSGNSKALELQLGRIGPIRFLPRDRCG